MFLFGKKKLVWNEPNFYFARTRRRKAWIIFVGITLGFAALLTTLLLLSPFNKSPLWQSLLIGIGTPLFIWAAIEYCFSERSVIVDDKEIFVSIQGININGIQFSKEWRYPHEEIASMLIVRGDAASLPFHFISITTEEGARVSRIGVPKTLRLEPLARTFDQLGVPVSLDGWLPTTLNDGFTNDYVYDPKSFDPNQAAEFQDVPTAEQTLLSPTEIVTGLLMAYWMTLLWLIALIALIVWAVMNRQSVTLFRGVLAFIGMVMVMGLTASYSLRYGESFCSRFLVRKARQRVKLRASPIVDTSRADAIPIDITPTDQWANRIVRGVNNGFIQADPNRKRFAVETDKIRWMIPYASIRRIRIEEVQVGTAGESFAGELRCFVVLCIATRDGEKELGFKLGERAPGKPNDATRMDRAVALFGFFFDSLRGNRPSLV